MMIQTVPTEHRVNLTASTIEEVTAHLGETMAELLRDGLRKGYLEQHVIVEFLQGEDGRLQVAVTCLHEQDLEVDPCDKDQTP